MGERYLTYCALQFSSHRSPWTGELYMEQIYLALYLVAWPPEDGASTDVCLSTSAQFLMRSTRVGYPKEYLMGLV